MEDPPALYVLILPRIRMYRNFIFTKFCYAFCRSTHKKCWAFSLDKSLSHLSLQPHTLQGSLEVRGSAYDRWQNYDRIINRNSGEPWMPPLRFICLNAKCQLGHCHLWPCLLQKNEMITNKAVWLCSFLPESQLYLGYQLASVGLPSAWEELRSPALGLLWVCPALPLPTHPVCEHESELCWSPDLPGLSRPAQLLSRTELSRETPWGLGLWHPCDSGDICLCLY